MRENRCGRVDKSEQSCVQTKKVQNPCVQNSSCVGRWKNDGVEIIHNSQGNRTCQDADVKPIVRDPMDDDRVFVESGHVHSRRNEKPNRHVRNNVGSKNVELPWTLRHPSAV